MGLIFLGFDPDHKWVWHNHSKTSPFQAVLLLLCQWGHSLTCLSLKWLAITLQTHARISWGGKKISMFYPTYFRRTWREMLAGMSVESQNKRLSVRRPVISIYSLRDPGSNSISSWFRRGTRTKCLLLSPSYPNCKARVLSTLPVWNSFSRRAQEGFSFQNTL